MSGGLPTLPVLAHGQGSLVWDVQGEQWTDLVCGFGACLLGHAHPGVVAALNRQSAGLWARGKCAIPAQEEVATKLGRWLPPDMRVAGLVSTGMEAAEFALRLAATHTGRREFLGLARSMHGKSGMTAALCWDNALLRSAQVHTLPFVDEVDEGRLLGLAAEALAGRRIAALFLEPVQGSNGGHQASPACYQALARLCREHGTLLVVDEILCGLFRCGEPFLSTALGLQPDLLLLAKTMGNGIPASAVAAATAIGVPPQAMAGSTFAANPLAMAAVGGTLDAMLALPLGDLVADVSRELQGAFASLVTEGAVTLRGRGALWFVHCEDSVDFERALAAMHHRRVLVTTTGRSIRLLPAANIPLPLLREACGHLAAALAGARV